MAEGADITAAKRRQPAGRKSRQSGQRKSCSRVTLEKVLGITTSSSSGLTSDPNTGLIAYPAGCVIVLLHPKKNKQTHIINTSRKPVSALAFSHDGKHLVSGESGHMPCVRVWEVGGAQVAEVQSHKYGVSCVAFSTNGSYIVSVGYQHDMTVSVWDWKKGAIIASNKVSSRIFAVSFSQDSSYFVTAGNRHVKFWYLDASKERRVNSTVPLIGRSGLLGDHKNSMFSGVACGRGLMASNTYCITSSSLLCLFNSGRQLEAWVDLKTSSASCLCVSDDLIFCGCADGLIRVFSQSSLQYVTTLQRPHRLGVDLAHAGQHGPSPSAPAPQFPGTLALTFDPASKQLTCVYNDHSVYVWDVHDVRNVGKLYSALYHSGCVWNVQVYPDSASLLPPSSFLTCSSDNTIRLWHSDSSPTYRNLYSNDLLRIVYVGEDTQHLQAEGERGEAAGADGKSGIRVLGISPDGRHLAAGDRCGNLRIFGLEFLDELVKIEAHDSEVLCLEFSPTSTGVQLLASASRDRLIHVFNLQKNYSLEQTLNDHSASITAVKFIGQSPAVRMVSCGADKSIYFQKAEQAAEGLSFSRSHHVVEKTTLYDMDLDSSRTHVAIACQDRNIRVYNVETGKLKKCLKGSSSDEGALLKVHIDPSGSFYATSCSDKNIAIFDYESGECVATLFGHSEIVTCMRFSQDCRHLITVSGDSCVFVWRLDSQMTATMRKKRGLRPKVASESSGHRQVNIRRETFITVPSSKLHQTKEEEEVVDLRTPARPDAALNAQLLQTNGKLPLWFRKLQGQGGASAAADQSDAEPRQGRSRWTEQLNPLTICSTFSPSPARSQEEEEEDEEGQREEDEEEEDFHPQSLESLLGEEEEDEEDEEEEEEEDKEVQTSCDPRSFVLYPDSTHREFDVEAVSHTQLEVKGQQAGPAWSTQLSPDSACSEGSAGSLEPPQDADTDSLSQGSSVGSLGLEDDEDRNALKNHFDTLASSLSEERFDTDLRALKPQEENHFLNPRLSITTRFLSRFQDRFRAWPSRAPPPVAIPTRISEESSTNNTTINVEQSGAVTSESTLRENSCNGVRCSQSVLRRRASCMISHHPLQRPTRNRRRRHTVVVVQCRKMLGDVGSRNSSGGVVASVQQGTPPRLGYLGTTASSRAKVNQDQEGNQSSLEPQDLSPLTLTGLDPDTKPDLDQDQPSASVAHQATPTDTTPQGGVQRWSDEETPTNHNQTVIVSPAPTITPTATPTACDIITISKPTSDVITCPTVAQEDGLGQTETMIQTGPRSDEILDAASSSLSLPTSCPTSDRLRPPQTGSPEEDDDEGESVTLQQCEQAAQELRRAATRAARLHRQLKVAPPADAAQMSSVLQEAFDFVCSELQPTAAAKEAVPAGDEGSCGASCGKLEDDRTVSLLEKYSELLVQMTQNKLNRV